MRNKFRYFELEHPTLSNQYLTTIRFGKRTKLNERPF